ncbi:MAG TPA: YigZ family protein [Bacteroidales bacterium]|nr:YigZ family protein [Bacteroidales bacterium]
MEISDTYLSISGESRSTFRDKASRFIGLAMPVESEEEAKLKLEAIRKEYYDANHHCYAYRIGSTGDVYRVNDDGEPSGTAGRPIHGQILSKGLSDILVVVIRYFGGTKLGVPGLIHAYKTTSAEALSQARIIQKTITEKMVILFEYPRMNEVMRILKDDGVSILSQQFDESCRIVVAVRKSKSGEIKQRLSLLMNISICEYIS